MGLAQKWPKITRAFWVPAGMETCRCSARVGARLMKQKYLLHLASLTFTIDEIDAIAFLKCISQRTAETVVGLSLVDH